MNVAWKWGIDLDTRGIKKGTGDAADAVDDLVDVMDDFAKSADKATDKAGDSFDSLGDDAKGAAREVDTSAEKVEDSFREAFKDIQNKSKSAFDDVGDHARRASHEAGGATSEFKDEARQNFGEVTSSFTGDMDSIADLAQGTFGGLAASLTGPLGLAFGGLAAAAGLFYNAWKENSEKSKQAVSDMYDDMIESGADFLSKDFITDQLKKIYQGADDAKFKIQEIRDLAAKAQVSEPLLARALVGDKAARDEVSVEIAKKRLEITTAMDEAFGKGLPTTQYADALLKINGVEDALKKTATAAETARKNSESARQAISGIEAPTKGVASSAEDARGKFSGLGDAIANLPDPKVTLTVDTSAATNELNRWKARNNTLLVGVVARAGQPQAV